MAESEREVAESDERGRMVRLVEWFDSRLGLSYELLRPAPRYAINPFYWLGALAVVAFVIQGVTGIMMMLYYVPTPTEAFASTQYLFQHVSYGRFLETVHLYTAYAMIMLAFMHMMRGYFVSVHKKPREVMWVVGMAMGFATLGFGFTGYLLPWTIVSKSATDVGIGMIAALPQPFSSFLSFLVVGAGGDAEVLLRFYDLHVVVLPAVILVLLAVKMYMLEAHGISEPSENSSMERRKTALVPIFPDVSFYLMELAALFGSAMLLLSVLFPLNLPPEYSPQLAATYVAQPDWYFLWVYQILKISVFEGEGLTVALAVVTLIFIVLILLPFVDRGKTKSMVRRKRYVTLGCIFVGEIVVLSIWGLLTPGRIIANEQAVLVLGGTALLIAIGSAAMYKLLFRGIARGETAAGRGPSSPSLHTASAWTAGSFVLLLAVGTYTIGGTISAVARVLLEGSSIGSVSSLALYLAGLSISVFGTIYLLYRLDLRTGAIRRRVRMLEVGWKE